MSGYLGIDWGTHSSKWADYDHDSGTYNSRLPIYGSEILAQKRYLTMAPAEDSPEQFITRGLKGVLIHDPLGTPFWSNENRGDTGTSLGEAVAFSLCALMNDAFTTTGRDPIQTAIGVSFPNWLVDDDPKSRAAARNFREAVAVAMEIVATSEPECLPKPGAPFSIERLKSLVQDARSRLSDDKEFSSATIMQATYSTANAGLHWGFITESGAAGLPYLRAMKIDSPPGVPGLAKVLVVDVGAGSTDIGYMLRTRHIQTKKESLYFFAPAASLPVAGNRLTKELMSYLRSRNERITEAEAEARKLRGGPWLQAPFVSAWVQQIALHVRDYVAGLPDHRWLPYAVRLNVVVTGGSGLVPSLKAAIRDAVCDGLGARGIDRQTIQKVETPGEHLPVLRFSTEAEYARRAVALGSSDADRPGVKFIDQLEAPVRQTVVAAPRWV